MSKATPNSLTTVYQATNSDFEIVWFWTEGSIQFLLVCWCGLLHSKQSRWFFVVLKQSRSLYVALVLQHFCMIILPFKSAFLIKCAKWIVYIWLVFFTRDIAIEYCFLLLKRVILVWLCRFLLTNDVINDIFSLSLVYRMQVDTYHFRGPLSSKKGQNVPEGGLKKDLKLVLYDKSNIPSYWCPSSLTPPPPTNFVNARLPILLLDLCYTLIGNNSPVQVLGIKCFTYVCF